jgi:hypothetical protein
VISSSCLVDWDRVVRIFSALLTPVIALLAAYIAWQQHKTNRNQFRLALLDKRIRVFTGAGELIATVLREAKIDSDGLAKFLWETREGDFLFGPDITAYLHELYGKAADVHVYEDAVDQELRNQRKEALLWFSRQGDELKRRFGKYMAFKNPD